MKMLMLFSDGFEEIEAAAPIDLLRRAGVSVETCSITENSTLTGAHGIPFGADSVLPQEIDTAKVEALAASYDGLLLPGGQPNAGTLCGDTRVLQIVQAFFAADKITAAICAAPCVFERAGILTDKKATSYPGCIDPASCAEYRQDRVVRDGTVITSRAAGTAIDFGLEILRGLGLAEQAESVRAQILY